MCQVIGVIVNGEMVLVVKRQYQYTCTYGKRSSDTQTHFANRFISPLSWYPHVNIEHNCSRPVSA